MKLYRNLKLNYLLKNNIAFIWDLKKSKFKIVDKIKSIDLSLLVGIDKQKKTLHNNTLNFVKGNYTNNALLWGARGNGKSTLIKSIFNQISNSNNNLRLIQLNKNDIIDIEKIYSSLEQYNNYRFIIFIDGWIFLLKNKYWNLG